MVNTNSSVPNTLLVIGPSTAGRPNTPLAFGNAEDAQASLVSGDLWDAVKRAFDPSNDTGQPEEIIAIRVNPATQSTLVLNNAASQPVINLSSTDYGQYTGQIKVMIEAASLIGLMIFVELGTSYNSADNIHRNAFTVQYTGGQATGLMTVTASTVVLSAPTGTVISTASLTTYPTIQQLVDFINTVPGFAASVNDGNGLSPALNGLDFVTNQDVKTAPYIATAHLQAVVDWFNGQGESYVTAVRVANAGTVPAMIPYTYLTGGSDGTTTNTNWSNAFTTAQSVDAQWVVPASNDPSIAAMTDAHVQYMSGGPGLERRAITGPPLGTSDVAAIALAKNINSDRTSLTHLGGYDYNDAGVLVLYQPFIVAAMIAGGFAGSSPGTPMTNKSLNLRGMERNLRVPTDTDALITGGVLCVDNEKTGYRVVKSISTWLTNANFNRVEQSTGNATDYVMRSWRQALAFLKGSKGSPQDLALAIQASITILTSMAVPDPMGPGALVGDAINPPFKNLIATLVGDHIAVTGQISPVIPVNYITVTAHAVPYTGTVTSN